MVVGPIGLADYAHRISLCLSALLNYLPATLGISCERSPTVSVPTVYGHSWGMSRWAKSHISSDCLAHNVMRFQSSLT
jgi:hypothetical protein